MNRILILFAHPRFEKSRVNRALLREAGRVPGVTLHDLYERYPDFNVDVEREKALLAAHEGIVWQHPFYMYGAPALLKQWIDLVLEYGWAHGPGGDFLKNKFVFNALTSGGAREAYAADGLHRFSFEEFLTPFRQTAALCQMVDLPPFVVAGTYRLTEADLKTHATLYGDLLARLSRGDFRIEAVRRFAFLNDWLAEDPEGRRP